MFHKHYEPFVRAFAARRIPADDVDDVVSEVFTTAWRRRDDVPDDALPWLYRVARNVVGNRYRSRSRLELLRAKLLEAPPLSTEDPADVAADRQRLVAAFGALSEDDQEILLLSAWEGLTNDEVARVLVIKPSAAAVRLHRARTRLGDQTNDTIPDRPSAQTLDITRSAR